MYKKCFRCSNFTVHLIQTSLDGIYLKRIYITFKSPFCFKVHGKFEIFSLSGLSHNQTFLVICECHLDSRKIGKGFHFNVKSHCNGTKGNMFWDLNVKFVLHFSLDLNLTLKIMPNPNFKL